MSFQGLISRLVLLWLIPFRLAQELFQAYVWRPKLKQSSQGAVANGTNGTNGSAGHGDTEDDVSRLTPEREEKVNEALDKW